jgi:hypothetical protein
MGRSSKVVLADWWNFEVEPLEKQIDLKGDQNMT